VQKGRPKSYLAEEHVERIAVVYHSWTAKKGLSGIITNEEARSQRLQPLAQPLCDIEWRNGELYIYHIVWQYEGYIIDLQSNKKVYYEDISSYIDIVHMKFNPP